MERSLSRFLILVGLVCFALAVAAVALHYRFPYQTAALNIKQRLEAGGPVRLDFEGPRPGRPFVFRLERVRLGLAASSGTLEVHRFPKVRFRLRPLDLLAGRLDLTFSPEGGRDRIEGRVGIQLGGLREIRLEAENIDLPAFKVIHPLGQGSLEGRLTGRVTVLGQGGLIPTGGQGSFEISAGRIEGLTIPQFPLKSYDFDRMIFEFKIVQNQLIVDRLKVESPQVGLSLSGRIRDLRALDLQLTGTARLGPAGRPLATAAVTISGPMDRPRIGVTDMRGPGG